MKPKAFTNEQLSIIRSYYEPKKDALKKGIYWLPPCTVVPLYMLIEGMRDRSIAFPNVLFDPLFYLIIVVPLIIFVPFPTYLLINLLQINKLRFNPSEFEIEVVEGIPKLGQGVYLFDLAKCEFDTRQKYYAEAKIDGKEFNLYDVPADAVGTGRVRFTAISKRSWLYCCRIDRLVIDIKKLT